MGIIDLFKKKIKDLINAENENEKESVNSVNAENENEKESVNSANAESVERVNYNDKTLAELIYLLDENNGIFARCSIIEQCEIGGAYIEKLFYSSVDEGGFGFQKDIEIPKGRLNVSVGIDGIYDVTDKNGNTFKINYKIAFVKNFFERNKDLKSIPFAENCLQFIDDCLTYAHPKVNAIWDENSAIYDPWIYEDDKNWFFINFKLKTVMLLFYDKENNLEKYHMYKRVQGILSDEYLTIDDLRRFKTEFSLRQFLSSYDT